MKLRCINNKIRIRLRKSNVNLLIHEGCLMESVSFPNSIDFKYGINLTEMESSASFEDNKIIISMNRDLALKWLQSSEVSFSFGIPLENENELIFLIEKDFPCKHTGDDFEDTYYELQPEEFKMHPKAL